MRGGDRPKAATIDDNFSDDNGARNHDAQRSDNDRNSHGEQHRRKGQAGELGKLLTCARREDARGRG